MYLFQSTHLHEVWHSAKRTKHQSSSFNPHTYMRCDNIWSVTNGLYHAVSIHTPTWGVTFCRFLMYDTKGFNPHTYMRCDIKSSKSRLRMTGFNPHTYMRCDVCWDWLAIWKAVSIHTPTWGVTKLILLLTTLIITFQSTHLHEVWLYSVNDLGRSGVVSIHTPTWGVTSWDLNMGPLPVSFNPHTYMRCD